MTSTAHRCSMLAGLIVIAGLAGCGSSNSPSSATGSTNSVFAMAQCMRAHGVSNFPDPTSGPGGPGLSVNTSPGSSAVTVNGVTFTGPAFQAATKACKCGPPGGAGPKISASQKQAALAFARCMRTHGVPSFPDPTFPAGGGIKRILPLGLTPQSPAFQAAAKACGGGRKENA